MADKTRRQTNALTTLLTDAKHYNFFQAVRLLKRLLPEVGKAIQFRSNPHLNFASNDIIALEQTENGYELIISFLGIAGQYGVLPEHYNETLIERINAKDKTLLNFLDMFNHRFIELFYEIWAQSHYFMSNEYTDKEFSNLPLLALVHALIGQPEAAQYAEHKACYYFYSGLYMQQSRTTLGLRLLLQGYFEVPVGIDQHTGSWQFIEKAERTQLSCEPKINNNRLGSDAIAGRRVWYSQNRFNIEVGPVDYKTFCALLPDEIMLPAFKKMVAEYVGYEYQFSVRILLYSDEIPACYLQYKQPKRLGWNSWLRATHNTQAYAGVKLSENYFTLLPDEDENNGESQDIN